MLNLSDHTVRVVIVLAFMAGIVVGYVGVKLAGAAKCMRCVEGRLS